MAKLQINFRPCKKIAIFAAMKIEEASAEEYRQLFPKPAVVYNSVAFTQLNAAKVDALHRVAVFSDNNSPLLGLTYGETAGMARAPFSAPFACFDFNREHSTLTMLQAAGTICREMPGLRLTLPPALYHPSSTAKTLMSLLNAGARLLHTDWNYHLDLSRPFEESLTSPARNKLRQAMRCGLQLEQCGLERAYAVIVQNRRAKGYDLAMTLEQVAATTAKGGPVNGDFFVLTDNDHDVASAIVFHVTDGIAQVIYWGDVKNDICRHPMNLLAALLHRHYATLGLHILDIGTSGHEGAPNIGLSDFKDAIGCICTSKPTLLL